MIVVADRKISQYLGDDFPIDRSEVNITVVVHIILSESDENISDAMVLTQIEAINRDFNVENFDVTNVPDQFNPIVGNPKIRFCLASTDPNGSPTVGIVRVKTDVASIGLLDDIYYSLRGGSDAWDTDKYLKSY